ncbi:class I adenylate-forming enzyme family protein [Lentzea sp. CA-135723]|uniref:class I adenylate-forming enzyme family protein n=1 Tax=Lentzea sp. CA-135723 TaxID=3239950 RepID=UPI003D933816
MTALEHGKVTAFLANARDLHPRKDSVTVDDVLADLAALRLSPGDCVILCMTNGVHLVQVLLATQLLGLVPLAVSPSTPWHRMRTLAGHVGARVIITTRIAPDSGPHHRVGTATAVPTTGLARPYAAGDVMLSTSGTSGRFSACLHRTGALLRNATRHATAIGLTRHDTVLINLPLHYSYAMVAQMLAAYVTGARLIISGPPFVPGDYRSTAERHDITHSSLTPTIVRQLLEHPDAVPRRTRVITVGGDHLDEIEVARLLSARPEGELYVTYGLTEAGPRVSTLAAHAEPAHRHGSVGKPLPGVTVSLRALDGDAGELLVESSTVMLRRVGEAGSSSLIRPGVVATGDLFHVDDGYLHFRGRLSDFVVLRGEKVSLRTVREAACSIPGVTRCVPRLVRADDGSVVLDLHLDMTAPRPDAESTVRRRLNAMLLPAERPRSILVSTAEPGAFRK